MKKEDVDNMLSGMELPRPEAITHQQELKIPLFSYKRSSKAGLWLLVLPLMFALTLILKYELGLSSALLGGVVDLFRAVEENSVLTYLIPLVLMGFPLLALFVNGLAICHFAVSREHKELLITVKYRPANIAVFLFSFMIIAFFLLPDRLP